MKKFNLIKKISMFLLFILGVSILAFGKIESYAIQFEENMMNKFPDVIKNNQKKIYEIYFLDLSQDEINKRYNKASIKANLTYNSTGKVYGWLEKIKTDKYKLIIASTGKTYLNTGESLFSDFETVTKIDFANVDTSKVTTMFQMFSGCKSLTSLDLSKFNTSKVIDMGSMFGACSSLTSLDLKSFDTSNVTRMSQMFSICNKLTSLDLSNFNTSKVIDMGSMFASCSSLTSLDLSNFNTSNVISMFKMFVSCKKLKSLNLSNFDTYNVEGMSYMFSDCSGMTSLNLSNFDTSKVTSMNYMFKDCNSITNLDLSNVSDTTYNKLANEINDKTIIVKNTNDTKNETKDTRSSINTLKTLSLSSGKINFNANTNNYDIQVDEDVNKVKITSELTDTKSKYVNGFGNREVELKMGLNKILVKVMAENESIRTYTLNITRGEIKTKTTQTIDNIINCKIKELIIDGHEIDFSSDTLEYDLTIKDEDKLDIKVELENKKATYEILGNENLENGRIIIIKVKSEDGSILKYKINIIEGDIDDNDDYIAYFIFGLALVLFIIAIIVKKKK